MGRHHKHGPNTVAVDASGDVTNMRGTVTEAPIARPYVPQNPDQKEKTK